MKTFAGQFDACILVLTGC